MILPKILQHLTQLPCAFIFFTHETWFLNMREYISQYHTYHNTARITKTSAGNLLAGLTGQHLLADLFVLTVN